MVVVMMRKMILAGRRMAVAGRLLSTATRDVEILDYFAHFI